MKHNANRKIHRTPTLRYSWFDISSMRFMSCCVMQIIFRPATQQKSWHIYQTFLWTIIFSRVHGTCSLLQLTGDTLIVDICLFCFVSKDASSKKVFSSRCIAFSCPHQHFKTKINYNSENSAPVIFHKLAAPNSACKLWCYKYNQQGFVPS